MGIKELILTFALVAICLMWSRAEGKGVNNNSNGDAVPNETQDCYNDWMNDPWTGLDTIYTGEGATGITVFYVDTIPFRPILKSGTLEDASQTITFNLLSSPPIGVEVEPITFYDYVTQDISFPECYLRWVRYGLLAQFTVDPPVVDTFEIAFNISGPWGTSATLHLNIRPDSYGTCCDESTGGCTECHYYECRGTDQTYLGNGTYLQGYPGVYCGVCDCQDINFVPSVDGWGFSNDASYWHSGESYPSWESFVAAFGPTQCLSGSGVPLPSVEQFWRGIQGRFEGACYGFSVSSLLFFSSCPSCLSVSGEFQTPILYDVPLNSESRLIIDKYQLFPVSKEWQEYAKTAEQKSPKETLLACGSIFESGGPSTLSQHALYMRNPENTRAHCVVPFKCEHIPESSIWYIYVYEPGSPGIPSRVQVDISTNEWEYEFFPEFHGTSGLWLDRRIDQFGGYPTIPIIGTSGVLATSKDMQNPDDTETLILFGKSNANTLTSTIGTIGYVADSLYSSVSQYTPLIPFLGDTAGPLGYEIPVSDWTCQFTGLLDTVFYVTSFSSSAIIGVSRQNPVLQDVETVDFRESERLLKLTNPGLVERSYDLDLISKDSDSEIAVYINNCEIAAEDSIRMQIQANQSMDMDLYSSSMVIDIHVRIVSNSGESDFYTNGVALSSNYTYRFLPDWRESDSKLVVLVDPGHSGVFDDTLFLANDGPPPCCHGYVGDANCSGSDAPTVSDISTIIDYLFISGTPLCCIAEADANQSGGTNPTPASITVSDISIIIDYLFISGEPLAECL